MSLTLGEKLQQAREARGITISEVAEQTRISGLYLEAIENNDYRTLPGGIFNKGFVKSYARYVGVDEQEALQDYNRLIVEQKGENADEPKTYKPQVLTDERTSSSSLMTIIFAVVILGLMTWGILALVKYLQNEQAAVVANNSNANVNANANNAAANTNTNASPMPSFNEIKVEIKAVADPISVTSTVDGKTSNKLVSATDALTVTGRESVKIAYYRGFTPDKVQLTINGKQVTAPSAPAKGTSTVFVVNKENIAKIVQSGQITEADIPTESRPAPR
jgi:cytoskeleton protein RodZ